VLAASDIVQEMSRADENKAQSSLSASSSSNSLNNSVCYCCRVFIRQSYIKCFEVIVNIFGVEN